MVEKDGQEQQTLCRMGACTICFDISQDHVDAYLYRGGLPFLPSLTPQPNAMELSNVVTVQQERAERTGRIEASTSAAAR